VIYQNYSIICNCHIYMSNVVSMISVVCIRGAPDTDPDAVGYPVELLDPARIQIRPDPIYLDWVRIRIQPDLR